MDTPPPVSTDHIAVAAVKLNPNLKIWRWVNAQTLEDWGYNYDKSRIYTWEPTNRRLGYINDTSICESSEMAEAIWDLESYSRSHSP